MDEIRILQADDLADIDFACYFTTSITPQQLDVSYNKHMNFLSLKPVNGETVSFKDLGAVRFGNSKTETNYCQANSFSYKAVVTKTSDKEVQLSLTNK